MSAVVEQTQYRRGLILHTLEAAYPQPLARRVLERTMSPAYAGEPSTALQRDVAYLVDRGLVVESTVSIDDLQIPQLRITPDGIDIVQRVRTEPGVRLER